MPHITGKSLSFSLNVLKSLGFFEKPHISFKKASISLKMYLKNLAVFEKPSN
jgi:hypothetical protein